MKSIRVFQPGQFETGQAITLDKSVSNHLLRVLRLKNDQLFTLFNGESGEYTATLEISGKHAIAHIQSFTAQNNQSNLEIHLFQGISKGDRMDFAIQKSVELGVSKITPVICERTVVNLKADRLDKKLQHWNGVAISACEQSGLNIVPQVLPILKFEQVISSTDKSLKLLLDPLSDNSLHSLNPETSAISFLIGPEGGLSSNEIEQATEKSYQGIRLGPRILRTETAALTAIASAQLLWGDLK